MAINPYRVAAGPQLDKLVQATVFGKNENSCPAYSTNDEQANKLKVQIQVLCKTPVITGKTRIRKGVWFARFGKDPSTATEVLAESYPLAICRLALLAAEQSD